jgi:hypothetical protein
MKRLGKNLFRIKQVRNEDLRNRALIIDSQGRSIESQKVCIENLKEYFCGPEITVLTFPERLPYLKESFKDIDFVLPAQPCFFTKYGVALRMISLKSRKYSLIVLPSLDFSPLIASMLLFKSKVLLFNQWSQWWILKLRCVSEIFKPGYRPEGKLFGFKQFLKSFGQVLVLLEQGSKESARESVLLIDNGYSEIGQVEGAIKKINILFRNPRIFMLLPLHRIGVTDILMGIDPIYANEFFIKMYSIARQMLRISYRDYRYVFLLSLDASPIIVASMIMHGRLYLYNRYAQLWSIRFMPLRICVKRLPGVLFSVVPNILIFVYLVINAAITFLKRLFVMKLYSLKVINEE